jgi:hypothetical protein
MMVLGVRARMLTVGAVLAVLVCTLAAPTLLAQPAGPAWETLSLPGPVYRLFTPDGGVLYALAGSGLYRSDDGGGTWALVPVPHETQTGGGVFGIRWAPSNASLGDAWQPIEKYHVAIDPSNALTIYADTVEGLGKSMDGGQTWTTVLPLVGPTGREAVLQIAVSPADSRLVYVTTGLTPHMSAAYELRRSRDGGATWETVKTASGAAGYWLYPLYPDPRDPAVLVAAFGCSNRSPTNTISWSWDQGESFPDWSYIDGCVVGMSHDPATGRLYIITRQDNFTPTSTDISVSTSQGKLKLILRLDNVVERSNLRRAETTVTALVPTPNDAGVLYVGIQDYDHQRTRGNRLDTDVSAGVVKLTYHEKITDTTGDSTSERPFERRVTDQSYASEISRPGMGWVYDLALSDDGSYLYAATENGLWRLPDPTHQP